MYDWIDELLRNLRYRFDLRRDDQQLISFEQNIDMKGLRFLSDVINCTIKKKPITINYRPFYKDVSTWTIHPYYLKQYNNRWFLLGFNEEFKDLSVVALDRIEGLDIANTSFIRNRDFNFDSYFRNIIGISLEKDRNVEHIRLQFSKERFPYVVSKPIHHSQIVENEEERIVAIDVIPNKELLSELIWFGNDVEILFPENIRENVKEIISKMFQKYFGVKNDCTTA